MPWDWSLRPVYLKGAVIISARVVLRQSNVANPPPLMNYAYLPKLWFGFWKPSQLTVMKSACAGWAKNWHGDGSRQMMKAVHSDGVRSKWVGHVPSTKLANVPILPI